VDHVPPIGAAIRTYAAGQCLHTTVKSYNMHNNTCVLVPNGSNLELTTTIEKTSRSAVRTDGLTADEVHTVNHIVERLTDNTQTHTTEWKPYGTIARVQCVQNEPQVVIVRTEDATTEQQPLVDVMHSDMMRLGKLITDKQHTRGRAQNRDRSSSHKKK